MSPGGVAFSLVHMSVLVLLSIGLGRQSDSLALWSSPRRNSPLSASPQVWLSVSSQPYRRLVLNWHRLDRRDLYSAWIGLYEVEPTGSNFDHSYIERVFPGTVSGKHITSKPYEHFSFQSAFTDNRSKRYLSDFLNSRNDSVLSKLSSSLWSGCVKYWIAYVQYNRRIVAKKCLRTWPRWMEESMPQIGHRSILELALPGTHNAGSYEPAGPAARYRFPRLDKYIYCQEESVWNQLIYGIRFLDLRVAYDQDAKSERDRVLVAHGPVTVAGRYLADVLEQVLGFLLSTHHEVVVIDFHRFEDGFQESLPDINERHSVVERLIHGYLGSFLVPVEMGRSPLRSLVENNKRVYVGYARDHRDRRFFHTNALHVWPGTDEPELLLRHLHERSCRSPGTPYLVSLMGALTPRLFGLIRDKYDGLRAMAEQLNHELSVAVFEDWWQCMNVLSTDYFLGNNLVELTVQANLKRP